MISEPRDYQALSAAEPHNLIVVITSPKPPQRCTWCDCDDEAIADEHADCAGVCGRIPIRAATVYLAGEQFPDPIAACAGHFPRLRAFVRNLTAANEDDTREDSTDE